MKKQWREGSEVAPEGILVGADLTQEWLLPWWFCHYAQHNTHPVAFADLGMSQQMKQWCRERGAWIPLYVADVFVAERSEIDPLLVAQMEEACGKEFWASRNAWFKKPIACLQTPFKKTLWIDLDCEVAGSLAPVFAFCEGDLAMAKDYGSRDYNSGVIAFQRGAPAIAQWAEDALCRNHLFRGDQDVLNALICQEGFSVTEIPARYNWSRLHPENSDAVVQHWHGPHGKKRIAHQIAAALLHGVYG